MVSELVVMPKDQGENNSQYAYRILYYNLMHLTLYPGQRLNETELTAALGISSTPFRQALSRLREEGLVDIRSQSGTTVSYIDYNLVQENLFIRATLEAAVIEQLCAEGISEEYQERIQENLEIQGLFAEHSNRERFFELDNEFHRLLFEAAGKAQTYQFICKSCVQFDRVRYINVFNEQTEDHAGGLFFYADHKAIFQTILDRDRSPMSQRVVSHLNGGPSNQIIFPSNILQYMINYPG